MSTIRLLVLLFAALLLATCQRADVPPAQATENAKGRAEEMIQALIKEDFAKIVDLTYPRLVELLGGRDNMIATMERGTKEMRAEGIEFTSATLLQPGNPVKAGDDLYIVIPFHMAMKVPVAGFFKNTFVIGLSQDQGRTWVFVNGDVDPNRIRKLLPDLPADLKIPQREEPTLIND